MIAVSENNVLSNRIEPCNGGSEGIESVQARKNPDPIMALVILRELNRAGRLELILDIEFHLELLKDHPFLI